MIEGFGLKYILHNLLFLFKIPIKVEANDSLMVVMRCWPDVYNIDIEENRKCPSRYYRDDQYATFCYGNILGSKDSTKGKDL